MRRWFRSLIGVGACACAVAAGFFFWPHSLPPVAASAAQPVGPALIARGEYLTQAADCAACHTAPGRQPFAGGRAFDLPFGTIYAPNITPDAGTGIGAWTDAEFVRALRQGIDRHGRNLYPAFPYTSYALLSTDDALAIRAYLAHAAPHPCRAASRRAALSFQPALSNPRLESAVPSQPPSRNGTGPDRRRGIGAPIWSRRSAIAASAIRRALRCLPWTTRQSSLAPSRSVGWPTT